jgi:hypothetical protein
MRNLYKYMIEVKAGETESIWRDIIWMWQAMFDPDEALAKYQNAGSSFQSEPGTTRPSTFYWISNMKAVGKKKSSLTCNIPLCINFDYGTAVLNLHGEQVKLSSGQYVDTMNDLSWVSRSDYKDKPSVTSSATVSEPTKTITKTVTVQCPTAQ